MWLQGLLIGLALAAFVLIAIEDVIHLNKAKTTLLLGTFSWLLLFIFGPAALAVDDVPEALNENLLEIATLWLFLMAAMTFVAFLNAKGLIANLIYRLLPKRIGERGLLYLTGLFAFAFSSLADNITATLVSLTLVLSLGLAPKKTLRFAVLAVFAVNSGGVALITGDVTTLMIFLAGKVRISELMLLALPSFLSVMLLATLLLPGLGGEVNLVRKPRETRRLDRLVAWLFLATILSTLGLNVLFGVPPLLTFLFGMSLMFLLGHVAERRSDSEERRILDYIRIIEFDTLLFFLGILLMVGALKEARLLEGLAQLYALMPAMQANYLVGLLSALVDNVPLTAAVLKADVSMNDAEWLALTYAAGVGGSLLVIGSAAGVIALSKVREVSFMSYLRFFPALLLAYSVGYLGAYWLGGQITNTPVTLALSSLS
ncbi:MULTISPECIES: sodium:proton antiporter NhaD [Cobetia]|uniref:sodium:proton antiporter NhaD n=1 Tax=Cobetia TaxID=204286 RepID=UPI001583390B|nr:MULTISPECIES: sodium:proton antiporter NhaD [Cobetia]MDI4660808.1 sodium:proton antiporter NhaD [Cobetia sp. BMC6]NUJ56766.1 sodium:proton antiporter NhaD [Cobetia marina]